MGGDLGSTVPIALLGGAGFIALAFFVRANLFTEKTRGNERKDMQERVTELRAERAALEAELSAARAQKFESDTKAAAATAETTGLRITLRYSVEEIERLKLQIFDKDQEIAMLERQISGNITDLPDSAVIDND